MNTQETKDFLHHLFQSIECSDSIEELIELEKNTFEAKERMDPVAYPKIDFSISKEEIDSLIDQNIIDEKYQINSIGPNSTPLEKLLFSLIWKNGDLKKIKHINRGIHLQEESVLDQKDSLVFFQFGKYLTKEGTQPIIDQHVIRAFAIYIENDLPKVEALRKLSSITKKEKTYIKKYLEWLDSTNLAFIAQTG